MAKIAATMLTPGKVLATEALVGKGVVHATHFNVGAVGGFVADKDVDVDIRGALVFTGGPTAIRSVVLSEDTARYELTIDENAGPFDVGNVVLFGEGADGDIQPYIMGVLEIPVKKKRADNNLPVGPNYIAPGNRIVINIEVKHTQETPIASITVITPNYSSLAVFEDTASVPNGGSLTWQQVVSGYDDRTKSPVLVAKDPVNNLWGVPFWQHLSDPNFGTLYGGHDGYGYGPIGFDIVFGGFYLTPDASYDEDGDTYGGAAYTDEITDEIGGAPYVSP